MPDLKRVGHGPPANVHKSTAPNLPVKVSNYGRKSKHAIILQIVVVGTCLLGTIGHMTMLANSNNPIDPGLSMKEHVLRSSGKGVSFGSDGRGSAEIAPQQTARRRAEPEQVQVNTNMGTFDVSSTTPLEGEFVYANNAYRYRYSPRSLQNTIPMKDGNGRKLPTVVYGVCSNGVKPIRRQAIRKSWGKDARVFFMVAGDWEGIAGEFQRHGDLLWIDTPEDYRDALTPKTFGFIHMATTQLFGRPDFQMDYIFKTDDDVYINATEMSIELDKYGMPQYYGLRRAETAPIRTATNETAKWVISRDEYPDDLYPPYAHGTGYALAHGFAKCAVRQMSSTLPMPWEDVATGILAQKCAIDVTPADEEWSHFLPFSDPETWWNKFPYEVFQDGGVPVKILHKVLPWYFVPLSQRESLHEAREYIARKRRETQERRKAKMKGGTTV